VAHLQWNAKNRAPFLMFTPWPVAMCLRKGKHIAAMGQETTAVGSVDMDAA